jgi:hypothetical protein
MTSPMTKAELDQVRAYGDQWIEEQSRREEQQTTPQFSAAELAILAEVLRGHRELLKHTPDGHSTSLDQLRDLEIKAASLAFLEISHDA